MLKIILFLNLLFIDLHKNLKQKIMQIEKPYYTPLNRNIIRVELIKSLETILGRIPQTNDVSYFLNISQTTGKKLREKVYHTFKESKNE